MRILGLADRDERDGCWRVTFMKMELTQHQGNLDKYLIILIRIIHLSYQLIRNGDQ